MQTVYHPPYGTLGNLGTVSDWVGGWSTFLLVVLGLVAFYGTLLGVLQSRRDAKRARTLEYLCRFGALEPFNTQVMTFLWTADPNALEPGATLRRTADQASAAQIGSAFHALDVATRARVTGVLNFYEEVSASYRQDLLDDGLALEMVWPLLEYGWEAAGPLIAFLRQSAEELTPQPENAADAEAARAKAVEAAKATMRQLEAVNELLGGRRLDDPPRRGLLELLDSRAALMLCAFAVLTVLGSLIAIGTVAAAHNTPGAFDSFLVAAAAALTVLAVVAIVPMVERVTSAKSLLVSGAVIGIMALIFTVGLMMALDLGGGH